MERPQFVFVCFNELRRLTSDSHLLIDLKRRGADDGFVAPDPELRDLGVAAPPLPVLLLGTGTVPRCGESLGEG